MDEKTRGFIEKSIDEMLRTREIMVDIRWVQEAIPIKSIEDLALGFAIGVIGEGAFSIVLSSERQVTQEDRTEIIGMIERRIPEIRQKILTELGR